MRNDLLLKQNITKSIKLVFYNEYYVEVGEIQGDATSFTCSIKADSPIRRTASVTLYIGDESNIPSIWLDNVIRAYIGLLDEDTDEYEWVLVGTFLISDNSYFYDATNQELALSLVDMMAAATESRGSQIESKTLIPYNVNVRNAFIATISAFSPFSFYNVIEFPDTVPYDIIVDAGAYPIQLLQKLLELYPYYQHYYSVDGRYTVESIPTGIGDSVYIDHTVMDELYISERRSNSFSSVKNTTEIWGMELDAAYTASACSSSGNTYTLSFSTALEVMEANSTYSFTPNTTSITGQKIKIQNFSAYPVYGLNGDGTEFAIVAGALESDRAYVVKYTNQKFILQGELLIHAIVKEVTAMPSAADIASDKTKNDCRDIQYIVNPDSRFAVDVIGEVRQVLSGGEYNSISTTALALERCAYENWKTTRLQDTVVLECLLNPYITVNKKIAYTSPITGSVGHYMVQGVDMDYANFTMTVNLIQFYPAYPFV